MSQRLDPTALTRAAEGSPSRRRKLLTGAKVVNWAASVPGTIQDWKDLRDKVGKVAPAVTVAGGTAPLLSARVREWIMDSAAWGDVGLISLVVLAWMYAGFLLVRLMVRERARARRVRKDERAAEQARRIGRRTWGMSSVEWVSPERAAEIVRHEHVSYVLVEEFIQRNPDACREGADGKVELERLRLFAWLVRVARDPASGERAGSST